MKKIIHLLVILSLGWLIAAGCQPNGERKLYLFRHAEKITVGDDPELTQQGKERAQHLAKMLASKFIEAVYSTPTIRTRATVTPLSELVGISIVEYSATEHDDLIKLIRSGSGDVVVVGHSNTIHHIANYFRESQFPFDEIDQMDYDTFFEVDLEKNQVERKRYSDF